jgi:hypothetical protein
MRSVGPSESWRKLTSAGLRKIARNLPKKLGLNFGSKFGSNQPPFLGGFLKLTDAESMNFHCVPNQVLYQAEPLPEKLIKLWHVRRTVNHKIITSFPLGFRSGSRSRCCKRRSLTGMLFPKYLSIARGPQPSTWDIEVRTQPWPVSA